MRRIAGWRPAAGAAGVGVLAIALVSPLASRHHASLTAHMIQHLLIMLVAAPLILLGAPAMLRWPRAPIAGPIGPRLAPRPVPWSRLTPRIRAARALTHPAICWLTGTGVVIVWHVPAMFALAMHDPIVHVLQQGSFVVAGLLFWLPVVQPWPGVVHWPAWSVPAYLFAATLPCDALSAFLVFCDRVIYRDYLAQPAALQDQAVAGALMWVAVTLIYMAPAIAAIMRLLAPGSSPGLPMPQPLVIVRRGRQSSTR
jgi:cytochrome c oxidase assembly factor CtaG